jgi:YidC/Oxa1 family membrane protein insertase
MRQEARFLLAIALMIGVLVTTNILFPPVPPEEPLATGPDSAVVAGERGAEAAPGGVFTPLPGDAVVSQAPPPGPADVAGLPDILGGGYGETVTVESPLYRFSFTTDGARMTSAQLLQFQSFAREGVVELLTEDTGGALGMQIETDQGVLDLRNLPFEVSPREGIRLDEGGAPQTLTFRYEHPSGTVTVEAAYTFEPSSYLIRARTEVTGLGRALLVTDMGTGLAYNEGRQADESRVMAYVTNHLRDGLEAEPLRSVDEPVVAEGPFLWSVFKSKYFLFALMAGEGGDERYLGGLRAEPALGEDQAAVSVTQPLGSDGVVDYRLLMAPQDRDLLLNFENDLEEANPYGYRWMRPVVRPVVGVVLTILNFLHENLNVGYGWVLIIFGVMMRVVLFPLNQKAMRAQMRNMAVQPLLQEIQKKYKDQPEKLQKEMMKLYKDHGFNPLAGCLPMLLPWPVLITLFFVFQNAIQLRGESFLWMPNLSAADPLYILPVVLGLSMFLMQWISLRSMPVPNPQMKMMMWLMPIMMTGIFFRFASGLNLYYATSNIAMLPQQWWIAQERQKIRKKGPLKPEPSGD